MKKSARNITITTDKNPANAIEDKSDENAAAVGGGFLAMASANEP